MLLYREGSLVVAGVCSLQYALMCAMEYQGIIAPFAFAQSPLTVEYNLTQVLYKVMLTATGCFAVAVLSSHLAEQARKSKRQLWAMEDQVKRVENMAAIGEMAAGLAHEIKNPLASLLGSIQILKDGIHLDADHERLMHIVLREADRLNSLANNFLLFAKPPAGKVESINLEKALTDIIELFEKNDSNLGEISVEKEISPGFWIEMDPTHLRQVMWNLLLNAAEAIEGDGQVTVKLYPARGKYALIEISDNGCGMSNETIQSIFDPFFTTKPSGTGLGLSIVHSILESYNCPLEVRSQIGFGTTFALQLKCIEPPPNP
jgi:two-component system sensor histidine kinase PilS (NtrC family)